MKKQSGIAHLALLLTILVVATAAGAGYYVWHSHKKTSANTTQTTTATTQPAATLSTFSGTVTKFDLSAMATDGPGYYTVKASDGVKTVSLTSGESSCDRLAILVPKNIQVGDDVTVSAKLVNDKYQVCDAGTYIKLKQAYLLIKQWGIRFAIPSDLTTMKYALNNNSAYLGSADIEKLDAKCVPAAEAGALGSLIRSDIKPNPDPGSGASSVVKVQSKYYYWVHGQSGCSGTKAATNLQYEAWSQLKTLVPQTISTL